MNNTRKYVASTTLDSPEWQNSTVIEGDVAEALSRLKRENGKNIMINGSATLVRSLLHDNCSTSFGSSSIRSWWALASACSKKEEIRSS
jgi:dihydrofolate reductase